MAETVRYLNEQSFTHSFETPRIVGTLALADAPQPVRPDLRAVPALGSTDTDKQPVTSMVDLSRRRLRRESLTAPTAPVQHEPHPQKLYEEDLKELGMLQRQFDAALGRDYDSEDLLHRSYNPVIDVLHIRQLRRSGDVQGESGFRNEVTLNLITNLRERYKASKSTINYSIEGGEVYSELFPQESFDSVLERGVQYRLQHNTPEAEREGMEGEQGGWAKIQKILTDPETKIGTHITSFSPHGIVEKTAYTGNFIDDIEVVENEQGQRAARVTRHAVSFTQDDFNKAALALDPQYFDNYDGSKPWDAYMLNNPIAGSLNIVNEGQLREDFVPDVTSGKLKSLHDYYQTVISADPPDWIKIAMAFNAILNQADEERKAYLTTGRQHASSFEMPISQQAIQEEVARLGLKEVKEVQGTGCPPNKGFTMPRFLASAGGMNSEFKVNSVSRFANLGGSTDRVLHCKACPICGAQEIDAKITGGNIICPVSGCTRPYVC